MAYLCQLDEIATDSACQKRGSFNRAAWAKFSDIDWDAIAASAAHWTAATEVLLDYIMVGPAVFNPIESEKKLSEYNFTYTSDNDFYELLILIQFEGKSASRRLSLQKAISCCDIIFHIFDNNGMERVVGVEWDGTSLVKPLDSLVIGRHLDTSGNFTGSKPRDEVDLTGESLSAPLFATVGYGAMPF